MSPTPNSNTNSTNTNDTDNHDLELCDHVTANNKNKTKSLKMSHIQFVTMLVSFITRNFNLEYCIMLSIELTDEMTAKEKTS